MIKTRYSATEFGRNKPMNFRPSGTLKKRRRDWLKTLILKLRLQIIWPRRLNLLGVWVSWHNQIHFGEHPKKRQVNWKCREGIGANTWSLKNLLAWTGNVHLCTIWEITFLVGGPWKFNLVLESLEKSLKNGCNYLYEPWYCGKNLV